MARRLSLHALKRDCGFNDIIDDSPGDAFQSAKWSSRNVIPAKIALGVMFAVLGAMLLFVA